MRGVGPADPKIIVLAEGPGINEVQQGVPLVGRSGAMLMGAMKQAGFVREDVWLGNVTLCKPGTMGSGKDKLVEAAIDYCQARVVAELDALPNVPILVLGRFAAQWFLGDEFKITELAGSYHKVQVTGLDEPREVIPTIHPAAILRGGGGHGSGDAHASDLLFWNLVYDVSKAKALADNDPTIRFTDDIFWEATKRDRAATLIERIVAAARATGRVAIDTETTGVEAKDCRDCHNCDGHVALDARHAQLVAIGLATDAYAVSVAWAVLNEKAKNLLRKLLADASVEKVFHNRLYDMIVLERNGFPVHGTVHCTLLAHHNAFPGLSHRLQRVATQFFAIGPWKAEFRHGLGEVNQLLKYNARDTLTTARLLPQLTSCIVRSKAEKTYEIDLKMAEIAERMQVWGIPIDLDRNQHLAEYLNGVVTARRAQLQARITGDDVLKAKFLRYIAMEQAKRHRKDDPPDFHARVDARLAALEKKPPEFNPNSLDQVCALLQTAGVQLFNVTASGRLSTSKDVLENLATTHEAVRALLGYREAEKLMGTFIRPIPYLIDKNHRIHVEWSPNKITGRWGSSPNFQNHSKGDWPKIPYLDWLKLPDDQKKMPNIRAQVRVPPGRALIGCDYKQLEVRIIALLSGDPYLCKAFMDGLDIHDENSRVIFPEYDTLEPNKRGRIRDHVKRAEYGYFYRAAPMTVWSAITKEGHDVPLRTINYMFSVFRQRMPRVESFYQGLFKQVMDQQEIRSAILGRRRAFPTGNAEETVVANFPIQATAADIMDLGLARFYEQLPDGVMILLQGHDALEVECDERQTPMVKQLMIDCLTQEFTVNGVTMQFPIDIKVGHSWDEV